MRVKLTHVKVSWCSQTKELTLYRCVVGEKFTMNTDGARKNPSAHKGTNGQKHKLIQDEF